MSQHVRVVAPDPLFYGYKNVWFKYMYTSARGLERHKFETIGALLVGLEKVGHVVGSREHSTCDATLCYLGGSPMFCCARSSSRSILGGLPLRLFRCPWVLQMVTVFLGDLGHLRRLHGCIRNFRC